MKTILGIEGGGTKTEWCLLKPGENANRSGLLPAANLRLIGDEALDQMLRLLPQEVDAVGVYLAGCVTPGDHARLEGIARRVWPAATLAIGSDRESGFAAALPQGEGVAVIAGTGSAITGKRGSRTDNAGGWGHLLGSKGSGYDLAMQALRAVLWHYDLTRRITSPGEAILARLGLNRLEDLIAWAADAEKMAVASLAPVVFEAAEQGDRAMEAIRDTGAQTLAEGAIAVAQRLGLKQPSIRLQGGLFVHYAPYVERFRERVAAVFAQADVAVCSRSGAHGAAELAARRLGVEVKVADLSASLPEDAAALATAATEQVNPRSAHLSSLKPLELVDLFVEEERHVTAALAAAREPLAAAIEVTANALRHGGRLFYIGAGTSGRLGVLDASELPPTFGVAPQLVQAIIAGGESALRRAAEGAEDHAEAGSFAMLDRGVRAGDVVCGIAASGRTPFVLGALGEARANGAHTLLLTCNPQRPRHDPPWEVEIDLPTGPELLTGSTRLKAGTATKVALNLLSTGVMIALGHVRGNLMSGVRASNAKLRDRAIRLVAQARGESREEAARRLEEHGWEVAAALED